MSEQTRPTGMRAFWIIWAGQVVSLLGTAMTNFGLTIWAFEETGEATALAMVGFFFITPMVILSPMAGAIVDRSNRKLMMMLSDLAAGLTTIVQLTLLATGNLEIWHLFVTAAISGTFQTFQWPAFSAAMTLMLPKEQYGRANGLMQLANAASGVFAPLLAGALLSIIGLTGIMVIDIVTFAFAIGALLFVFIPQPERSEAGRQAEGDLLEESRYGFWHIIRRPSLLGLQLVFMGGNLFFTLGFTLLAPMILARTGNNELIFGTVNSAGAIGGVVGGLAMSAWGGPKRRVLGVLGGWFLIGLFGETLMGLGQALPIWLIASFLGAFLGPIIDASNQAIWMAKVEPDVQGRVFGVRRMIAWAISPVARLVAGPLADKVFEPAMQEGGGLADTFGWLVGTGTGAGMSLILVVCGIGVALVAIAGYATRVVRNAEDILPDFDAIPEETAAPAA
ncbi:MAG: MFS transporter [Anaerolineae bacterium]|nr:MFS transporter [Anaerolineae bacterium]